jgi:hypothetical protein
MKSGIIMLGAAAVVLGGAMACPPSVRSELVDRTNIPQHYVLEAERQLDVFVTWLRADGDKPASEDVSEPALG